MEVQKQHYKMYKSGKAWVMAGLFAALLGVQSQTIGHADTVALATPTVDTQAPENQKVATQAPVSDQAQATKTTPAATSTQSTGTNDAPAYRPKPREVAPTTTKQISDTAGAPTQAPVTEPQTSTATTKQPGEHTFSDGGFKYRLRDGSFAKGFVKVDKNLQYFDQNGFQVKGAFVTINGGTYYTDPNSGNIVTGVQQIAGKTYYFQESDHARGQQFLNGFFTDDKNDITYYLKDGVALTGKQTLTVNGQTADYLFDDQGRSLRHGTSAPRIATQSGNQVVYSDPEGHQVTGSEKATPSQPVSVAKDYLAQNAAYDTSDKSFQTVDGYLTADSWYRPKQIHDNGTQWRASRADEFRPLLMVWNPYRESQVTYLNYMVDQKLLSAQGQTFAAMDKASLDRCMRIAQDNIERKISQEKNTDWLRQTFANFINAEPQWSANGERHLTAQSKTHMQDSALRYLNSPLTPDANSNFRLLNRTPSSQTGETQYYYEYGPQGIGELLLANDIDNSNPIVQAEQLNWLHYMMNFGSLTGDHDAAANFDGIRVDAVDNVNADLLQIASDYFKQRYQTTTSDKNALAHLSIQEDWSANDPVYTDNFGNPQLTMDNKARLQMIYSLCAPVKPANHQQIGYAATAKRDTMKRFMEYNLVDRADNTTENEAIPNYSFVRAHDSGVQTIIADILTTKYDKFNGHKSSDGVAKQNVWTASKDEIKSAMAVYRADMLATDKKALQYNIPSAYALMLTNKDTVPRPYYGDLYMEDGQYMAEKTPYFDAIDALLKARVAYVGGGQQMAVDKNDILTSVRYGKGAMTADDMGTAATRTQGIGVIIANDPEVTLRNGQTVVLKMGASHRNQAFRAVLTPTAAGLQVNTSDHNAPVKYTDGNGDLIFTSNELRGYRNPQLSGFLSVWVPVGADATQDARTAPSAEERHDGNVFRSNAALDSQVIYEGFSTFQDQPASADQRTNVVLAKNTDLLKQWGVTSVQLAPQYRSSSDTSFLDATMANGYAFTDRYDLGFGAPTKYGDVDDLRDVLRQLHRAGIQAMADFVPDQLYNLPGKELVTATYADSFGRSIPDQNDEARLYVSQTKSDGGYQAIYGGKYLDELKQSMPAVFERKQISTGVPINGNVKITQWSAKYFNGTNGQGQGANRVLRDNATKTHYRTTTDNQKNAFLPQQLLGNAIDFGFKRVNGKTIYRSESGYYAKDSVVTTSNGDRYYFDRDGNMATGLQQIGDATYYFLADGRALCDTVLTLDGQRTYHFSKSGRAVRDNFMQVVGNRHRAQDKQNPSLLYRRNIGYFGDDGQLIRDKIFTIDGGTYQTDKAGFFLMNRQVTDATGTHYYNDSGIRIRNEFKDMINGAYAYYDNDGNAVTGMTKINSHYCYFDDQFRQVKGQAVAVGESTYYFDADTGYRVKNVFQQLPSGQWGYFGADGKLAVGRTIVKNTDMAAEQARRIAESSNRWSHPDRTPIKSTLQVFFNARGEQVKGDWVDDGTGYHYYREDNGDLATNRFIKNTNGSWSYVDSNGDRVVGPQVINDSQYNFGTDYQQIKGQWADTASGRHYYLPETGRMATGQFVHDGDNRWYYVDRAGNRVVGPRVINDSKYNFGSDYQQIKGIWSDDGTGYHYYREDNGTLATNQFVSTSDSGWVYVDERGDRVVGTRMIDGQQYNFGLDHQQIKNCWSQDATGYHYYRGDTGALATNQFVQSTAGHLVYVDGSGNMTSH